MTFNTQAVLWFCDCKGGLYGILCTAVSPFRQALQDSCGAVALQSHTARGGKALPGAEAGLLRAPGSGTARQELRAAGRAPLAAPRFARRTANKLSLLPAGRSRARGKQQPLERGAGCEERLPPGPAPAAAP